MVSLKTRKKLLQISPPLNSTSYNTTTNNNDNNTNDNNPTVQTCLNFCYSQKNTTKQGFCPQVCLALCPSFCHYSTNSIPLPPNYPTKPNKPHINPNHSPLLISMLILLAITFLLITFYIIYTKLYFHFYAPYSNSFLQTRPRSNNNNNNNNININSLEGEHDHHHRVVFHPFWYISTVGLPTTAIQRIAVVKYHKEVMDEKDCAVCLAQFEEGESLRVLPKCSHAFHLPCIDTWLSLHTTCPLCRAPILDHHVDDHDHDHNHINQTVENASSSVVVVESTRDNNNNNNEELRVNNNNNNNDVRTTTTIEELGENNNNNLENYYCMDNFRRVNNKGSLSQRWSLERGAANLLSRSLSCSGKIFSSSCSRSCPNNS